MKQEAESNADADNEKLERSQKLNECDAMIFQTEKQLKDYEENLDDTDKSRLENDIKDLKELRKEEDMDGIEDMMEKMNETWQEISTKLYEETASEGEQTMNEDSGNQATDVEFEEVK
jgi:molecular chaperone DnaK